MLKHYDAPTVDVYFELKVSQYQYEKREKEMERKKKIERLKKLNEMSNKNGKKSRPTLTTSRQTNQLAKRPTFCTTSRQVRNIRLGSPALIVGQVYKGSTFRRGE
jgi:hypothetical protein